MTSCTIGLASNGEVPTCLSSRRTQVRSFTSQPTSVRISSLAGRVSIVGGVGMVFVSTASMVSVSVQLSGQSRRGGGGGVQDALNFVHDATLVQGLGRDWHQCFNGE